MKTHIFEILISGLLAVGFLSNAYAFDDGDFQVWHTEQQEWKINNKFKATMEEELRLGDDGGNLYYQHYDVGIVYAAQKWLDLGLNYRQIYEKKGSDFKEENEPHINATIKWALAGFTFDDRNRLEYRHYDWQEDSWRYRNKFNVKLPWKFTKFEIQPYFADEIFLNLNGIDLNKNRFYSGLGFTLTKNLKGEIYYMLQSSKASGTGIWADANVLGTKLKVSF
ncbi:MAG: DUF2490 domain-containing protein [Candidatus Omnitrophica bacterium]|nr:DUF2490 domain-containing protein [Candidatus Omnitrophota bacterium]